MAKLLQVVFIAYMAGGIGALLGFMCGVLLYALGYVAPAALPWFAVAGGGIALLACVVVGAG